MQFVTFNLQHAICNMQFEHESMMQFARCKLQGEICKMQFARCNLQDVICKMQDARCNLQDAICKIEFARCIVALLPYCSCNFAMV